MIVAVVAFCLSLVQLLLDTKTIPAHFKKGFYICLAILSGIPIILQLLIFIGEVSRAGIKLSIKLVCHRLVSLLAGNYSQSSGLVLTQISRRKIGEYEEPSGRVWLCLLVLGHSITKPFAWVLFGDAFSGIFTVRYTSLALWLGPEEEWIDIVKPKIDDDIFSKTHLKDVRHLNLVVEFRSKEQQPGIIQENLQPTRGHSNPHSMIVDMDSDGRNQPRTEVQPMTERKPELERQSQPMTEGQSSTGAQSTTEEQSSTGAHPTTEEQSSTGAHPTSEAQPMMERQSLLTMEGQSRMGSHLNNDGGQEPQPKDVSYHIIAKGNQDSLVSQLYYETWKEDCTKDNAREFLTFLEILNNDTFVVNGRPPDKNDQILTCIDLPLIVKSILREGKKVNIKRVFGMTYV